MNSRRNNNVNIRGGRRPFRGRNRIQMRKRRKFGNNRRFNRLRYRNNNNNFKTRIRRNINFNSKPRSNSQPNNSRNLNKKFNELKNDIAKLKLIEVKDPKINSTKKEMRKDKLIDASIMAKYSKMLGFYKTPSKIIRYCSYNKYIFNKHGKTAFIWFPYAYPYIWGKSHNHDNDIYASIWSFNTETGDFYGYHATPIDIRGNYRLVCATMKVSNVTSISDREGTYMIVKDVETNFIPLCYSSANNMSGHETITGLYGEFIGLAVNRNFSNTTEKQLYSCSEKAKVVEYNVSEGLNIFQGHEEYLGMTCKQDDQQNRFFNQYIPFNPIGQNIKYIVQTEAFTKTQSFCVETWQIFEIRPDSNSSYSAIATIGDQVFSRDVFAQAKSENNFKKEKL